MSKKFQNNELKEKADAYLREHRIMELFEDLCTALAFQQPKNIKEFLIKQLQLKQSQGFKTGLFASDEIKNIFTLFDLKRDGKISKDQCKQALKTLASSDHQFSQVDISNIPEEVDQKKFEQLCDSILGLK